MTLSENILLLKAFACDLGCKVRTGEPLSEHTTFKVGGPCGIMIFPDTAEHIGQIIAKTIELDVPYCIIGNGSNVLFKDSGYSGAVIVMGCDFGDITVGGDVITAYAGAMLIKVCKIALESSLSGMEFAYGIPGTVGGAVYMNAGAYGGEIKDIVSSVTAMDRSGNVKKYSREELKLGYRSSVFTDSDEIILSADFKLSKGDCNDIKCKMDELMARRKSRQPLEYPSAGSTFKRPEGTYAGLVIEESGLKGFGIGGAQVSEKHANFVINRGGATAGAILDLISHIKAEVKEKTGYELECEVKIIDDPGLD